MLPYHSDNLSSKLLTGVNIWQKGTAVMDKLNVNEILNRQQEINKMKDTLRDFELNKHNCLFRN